MEAISAQDAVTISDKKARLEELIETILEADSKVRSNLFVIVNALKIIDREFLYAVKGYKNMAKFAADVFGYSPTTTSRMLQVANYFLVADGTKSKFARGDKDFSINQLEELIPLKDNDGVITEMVASGEINPDMKVKQIRESVRAKKQILRRLPTDNSDREPQSSIEAIVENNQPEELNESPSIRVSLEFTEQTESATLPDSSSNKVGTDSVQEDDSEQSTDEESDSCLGFRIIELETKIERLESEKRALEEEIKSLQLENQNLKEIVDEYDSLKKEVNPALLEGEYKGRTPTDPFGWVRLVNTIVKRDSEQFNELKKENARLREQVNVKEELARI